MSDSIRPASVEAQEIARQFTLVDSISYGRLVEAIASALEAKDAELKAARTRIAELEGALLPFADDAEEWDADVNGGHAFADSEAIIVGYSKLSVGDLRRARSLLQPAKESAS
jgi:hypothetical protein